MQNNSPWRKSALAKSSLAKSSTTDKNPFRGVTRVFSVANLQESWGHSQERPTTSFSSATYNLASALNSYSVPDPEDSRTPTPTKEASPPMSPKNPWAKFMVVRRPSPSNSPGSSSTSQSPESVSRTNTPIAPQPLKPFIVNSDLIPGRDEMPFLPPFPTLPQGLGSANPYGDDGDRLTEQRISSELIQKEHRRILSIVQRQSWSTKKLVYQWVLQHPRTALLLWMAEDVQAWPKACIMGLEDKNLPYTEEDLESISENPQLVVELQWRVAIKRLPREGQHTEFATHETVPLQPSGEVHGETSQPLSRTSKRIDCVKWCDNSTSEVYVRKRLDVKAKPDKDAILARIREYHRLSHPNIAKIVASYARGQTVAFLTVKAEANLADYLDSSLGGLSEADQLLSWIVDLASALAFIHAANLTHRSIRPQKILVDSISRRISFAPFGIATPARSAGAALFAPYSADPAYIYAAPESVSGRRDAAVGAPADVWSLGCVMLEMATAARGTEVEKLQAHRAAESHDPSYHANQRRVLGWAELMRQQPGNGGSGGSSRRTSSSRQSRKERTAKGVAQVLNAVVSMLDERAEKRPSTGQVLAYLEAGREERGRKERDRGRNLGVDVGAELARGGMLGAGGQGVWGELQSLNGYYAH
jgi:serine/threonine protein kinase